MDWADGIIPRPDRNNLEVFMHARDILAGETHQQWYWSAEGNVYSDPDASHRVASFEGKRSPLASSVVALYNYAPDIVDAMKQMAEVINDERSVIKDQQERMDEIGEETAKMSVSLGILGQERVLLNGFVQEMLVSSDPEVSAKARRLITALQAL